MHIPTQEQWQTVIDNFKSVLPYATRSGHLNMGEGRVNGEGHICKTVHCVAGWYAVAVYKDSLNSTHLDFNDGAARIAIDLGFKNKDYLKMWADEHPGLWGNKDGWCMFIDAEAYNNARNLTEVIEHFEQVKQRCNESQRLHSRPTPVANGNQ